MLYETMKKNVWRLNTGLCDDFDTAALQVAVDLVRLFPLDISAETTTEELRKSLAIEINKLRKLISAP